MTAPYLQLEKMTKEYPGVVALNKVDIKVNYNEVVGLVGENGAGKSTLLKIISGIESPDSGNYFLEGKEVKYNSLLEAHKDGISLVFQEQSLLPNISVAENIFLGSEEKYMKFGMLNKKKMYEETRKYLEMVDSEIDPGTLTGNLEFSDRQMIEIAKSLRIVEESDQKNSIILFDEPTSVLEDEEIKKLFEIINEIKKDHSVIFVSHRLDEVIEISDRVYILKDGKNVEDRPTKNINQKELHNLMVGRSLQEEYYKIKDQNEIDYINGKVVLATNDLTEQKNKNFCDCCFELYEGEILGFAGVQGSGKEQLGRALFGLEQVMGEIKCESYKDIIDFPPEAINRGIAYIPKERSLEGLVFGFDVNDNINLPNYRNINKYGVIDKEEAKEVSRKWVKRLGIKTPSIHTPSGSLSGGNQQKVVLAKWLAINEINILILDHPTRGIDVGAKEEIYELMREVVKRGISIILTSDTLEELIGLSNRIHVMKDGEIVKTFMAEKDNKPTQEQIVSHMV